MFEFRLDFTEACRSPMEYVSLRWGKSVSTKACRGVQWSPMIIIFSRELYCKHKYIL